MLDAPGRDASRPKGWLPSVTAALVVGLVNLVLTVSLAALVFSGDLAPFLSEGIGLALLSAVLVGLVVGVLSSLRGMIASVQDAASAILAVAAAGAVAILPAGASPADVLVTIVVANGLTALITGAFLLATGAFGLGRLVRFLPYPVIGGFLAGTGWLIVIGSVGVMADVTVTPSTLAGLFAADALVRWLPGLAFGALALVLTERYRSAFLWPALLLAPIAAFYGAMVASGGSVEGWRAAGLLPAAFEGRSLLTFVDYGQLASVHWPAVWSYGPTVVAMCFIVAISVLFNTSAVELTTNEEVDLDTELRAAGIANLAVGSAGGLIGYQMLGDTVVARRIGRGTRAEALGSVAVVALGLLVGAWLIPLLPQFLIGGVLAYIGLLFLRDWLVVAFRTVTPVEYAIIVLILVVIASVGFLEGVGVGIVATVVLFVVDYARTDVVARELDGLTARSRVTRGRTSSGALDALGEAIYGLELQGFVFFGTATGLVDRTKARLEAHGATRFVVLDFRRVTGLDATARLAFEKLARLARRHDVHLVLSHASREVTRKLEDVRAAPEFEGRIRTAPTLDAALEWCEERLLADADAAEERVTLASFLEAELADAHAVTVMSDAFEPVAFEPGDALMRQGAAPDALYFVAAGKVTARLERDDGPALRFETMEGGSLVGELGFYTGRSRTASVVADAPTRAHRLTREALDRVTADAPEVAAAFHELVVRSLARRTGRLMGVLDALQR